MEERFTRIETRLDRLEAGQQRLEAGQAKLEAGQAKLEITVEQMRDDIRQIAEGHAVLLATMERGFRGIEDKLEIRLAPIEAALRRAHLM